LFRQIAREPIATWPGFIDEDEVCSLGWHVADELVEVTVAGADGPEVDDLSVVVFGNLGHRHGVFVNVQTDIECARLVHG
jgi:hypothetical protein